MGIPNSWMGFFMGNQIKIDDLGVPTISGKFHIVYITLTPHYTLCGGYHCKQTTTISKELSNHVWFNRTNSPTKKNVEHFHIHTYTVYTHGVISWQTTSQTAKSHPQRCDIVTPVQWRCWSCAHLCVPAPLAWTKSSLDLSTAVGSPNDNSQLNVDAINKYENLGHKHGFGRSNKHGNSMILWDLTGEVGWNH